MGKEVNRTQIYEKMINKLLSREISLHAIQFHPISEEMFKNVFNKLPYMLLDKGYAGRFPWAIVDSLLPELRITWGDFVRLTHLGIVSELVEGSPRPGTDLVFRHQSFQKYLASLEMKKHILEHGEVIKEILLNHQEYYRWDEVLFFLIGSLEEQYAKAIISLISQYDPLFACKCIAYYKDNKDKDFREIIDGLFKHIRTPLAQKILAKIGTEGIITRLVGLLKYGEFRGAAVDVLGMIRSEKTIEHLMPLLEDKDRDVHIAADKALEQNPVSAGFRRHYALERI